MADKHPYRLEPWPDTMTLCRADEDCGGASEVCLTYIPQVEGCGTCMSNPYECQDDAACGEGEICGPAEAPGPCVCEVGSRCQPGCAVSGCAEDERCGEDDRCAPRSCTEGYACAEGDECAPTATSHDPHGCAPIHCRDDRFSCAPNYDCDEAAEGHGCSRRAYRTDADCDCGACLKEICHDKPAICTVFQPDPPSAPPGT